MANWAKIHLLEGRLRWWRVKGNFRRDHLGKHKVEGQKAHKRHDQKGIERARVAIIKWKALLDEAVTEIRRLEAAINKLKPKPPPGPVGEGWSVPETSWNPFRRKIANWIIHELIWAHEHGWGGYVTSGLRTYAEQKRLYEEYLAGGNIAAPPGRSNHEGYEYTRGAIDTPQAEELNRVLGRKANRRLLWAETHGLADFVHFSGTGR